MGGGDDPAAVDDGAATEVHAEDVQADLPRPGVSQRLGPAHYQEGLEERVLDVPVAHQHLTIISRHS